MKKAILEILLILLACIILFPLTSCTAPTGRTIRVTTSESSERTEPIHYFGTATNINANKSAGMSFAIIDNAGKGITAKGKFDDISLFGKFDAPGSKIPCAGGESSCYRFKGNLLLGADGSGFPKGTETSFNMMLRVTNEVGSGEYTIGKIPPLTDSEQNGSYNVNLFKEKNVVKKNLEFRGLITTLTLYNLLGKNLIPEEYKNIDFKQELKSVTERYIDFILRIDKKDIDAKDADGNSLLKHAMYTNIPLAMRLLLHKGADVNLANNEGETPLLQAIASNDKLIPLLLAKGAKVNVANNKGDTPLLKASQIGDNKLIIRLAIKKGLFGRIISDKVINDLLISNSEKLKSSLSESILNVQNKEGKTPLMIAAENGKISTVKLLIDAGSDVNVKDTDGKTTLWQIVFNNNIDMCKLLLSYKYVDVNSKDKNGITPLMVSAINGYKEIAELLINRGADINTVDNNGRTALVFSATRGKIDITKLLLDKGANINVKDKIGLTIMALTARSCELETVRLLDTYKAELGEVELSEELKSSVLCQYTIATGKKKGVSNYCLNAKEMSLKKAENITDLSAKASEYNSATWYALLGNEPSMAMKYAKNALEMDKQYKYNFFISGNLGHAQRLLGQKAEGLASYKTFLAGQDGMDVLLRADFQCLKAVYPDKINEFQEVEKELFK